MTVQLNQQRVGIGTLTPTAKLDVQGGSGEGILAVATSLGRAVRGIHTASGNAGHLGTANEGVYAFSPAGNGTGIHAVANSGTLAYAVWGTSASGYGVVGEGPVDGVRGINTASGNIGFVGTLNEGVYGSSNAGNGCNGVTGFASTAGVSGVYGENSPGYGVAGRGATGVFGESTSGSTTAGVLGLSMISNGNGVIGEANNGTSAYGVWGRSTSGWAGYFDGQVHATGALNTGGDLTAHGNFSTDGTGFFGGPTYVNNVFNALIKLFKIDHPLDPANKYLMHSCVESSDMKNIYDGVVTTDGRGYATIILPDWFEALNRDFRYQLTIIDDRPDLPDFVAARIASKVAGNRFTIRTTIPGVEVSWQLTGIRKDAYALAHPLAVEQDKPAAERGHYLCPELYGQPEEMGIAALRRASVPTPGVKSPE